MKLTVIALYVTIILSWLTAVIADGNALRLGGLAVDIVFSPVGIVRGILMWIGLAGYTMSLALLIVIGYGLIAYVLVRDINKARKVYKFNYVRLGRWTVRQPNGRFVRNLANVWDIATLGSKL